MLKHVARCQAGQAVGQRRQPQRCADTQVVHHAHGEPGERPALRTGARSGARGEGQDDLDDDAGNGVVGAHSALNRQRHQGYWDEAGEEGKRQ